MKLFAFPAAFGLIFSLATVTPALNDKKDGRSPDEKVEKLERSMPVDPAATITVCVMSGAIEVRGWEKPELRVRSMGAAVLDFRRIDRYTTKEKEKEKEKQPQPPATRVDVMLMDQSDKTGAKGDCQAISDVAVDVPLGATIQVQTRDGDIHVANVAAIYAGSQNGDIDIERASKLVEAGGVGGSISLRDSSGRINLSSAGGTVYAKNIKYTSPEDAFEVATVSGDIQLDQVGNSRLMAKTVNGSVTLVGALARSGKYGFSTLSGDVILQLPHDASFQIDAKISENQNIVSDFPLKYAALPPPAAPSPKTTPAPQPMPRSPSAKGQPAPPTTPTPGQKPGSTTPIIIKPSVTVVPYTLRRITAICGSGDASISVASFSGTVRIKKL
jgi:hypothetical protein